MTAPDPIRAALERLTTMASDELTTPGLWAHSRSRWDDAIAAARAALAAAPEREPSDEELLESAAKALGYKSIPSDETCLTAEAGEMLAFARAVLARWGRPTAPHASPEGDVGELVAWLGVVSEQFRLAELDPEADQTDRAATLLEQLSAAAPAVVPVAIPGEQWHEDDGACLWWRFEIDEAPYVGDPRDSDWPGYHTHFTRIVCPVPPAPQGGEVEG